MARSLGHLLKSLFTGKLFIINLSATLYVTGWIYLFYCLDLWDLSLLKKTVLWFFGAAMVLVFKTQQADKPGYFKKLLKHLLEWAIITEFVESFYSFPLWIELIFIPFLLFMVGMSVFSKGEEKYRQIHGCTDGILRWFAISIFLLSFYETITHWRNAFNEEHIKDLAFAPIMTLLFMPYLYLLALYMGYEILFLRLRFWTKNNETLYDSAKRSLLRVCNVNLIKLNLAKEEILQVNVDDLLAFQQFLIKIKAKGSSSHVKQFKPDSTI